MPKYLQFGMITLGLLFAINHLVLGLMWLPTYTSWQAPTLAFVLYTVSVLASLLPTKELALPTWQAYSNLAVSVIIPLLVLSAFPIANASPNGTYQTWFVAGISTLLSITAIRGNALVAWLGTAAMWVEVIAWGGPHQITTVGLIGGLMLVAAAHALGTGIQRIGEQTDEYLEMATATADRSARITAGRAERDRLVQNTLLTGLPLLEKIVDLGGKISDADRSEAILLEQRFRDEIQGSALLSDGVRVAARDARKRNVVVNLLDEGGLTNASEDQVTDIRAAIASSINSVQAGTITVRAPRGEDYLVSVTAQRPEAAGPDLWLRLP